jgi:hypothetical protein
LLAIISAVIVFPSVHPKSHPATPATVSAVHTVTDSVDQEIISAVHVRALAAAVLALVGPMAATASTAGTCRSTASVLKGNIRAAIVKPPVRKL